MKKIVRTIGIIQSLIWFTRALKTGLGISGVSWWIDDNNLYILNATLDDMAAFCKCAKKQEFVFGEINACIGKYKNKKDSVVLIEHVNENIVPDNYLIYAKPITNEDELNKAFNDKLTFLGRSSHRRDATRLAKEHEINYEEAD
jgi:hypothetical protein